MKQLTPDQIQENWQQLRDLITDTFEGERLEKLNEMYDYFEDRMIIAPASGKEHYHNAHVGGYVEHVLHVTDCAVQLKKVWEDNGVFVGRSLDTYISKLRKILKDDDAIRITNIHGIGYKLEVD